MVKTCRVISRELKKKNSMIATLSLKAPEFKPFWIGIFPFGGSDCLQR